MVVHHAEKDKEGEEETPTKKQSSLRLNWNCGQSLDVNNSCTPSDENHRYQQTRPSSQKALHLRSNNTYSNRTRTRISPRSRSPLTSPLTKPSKRVKENFERKCAEAVVIDKKKINNDEEYNDEENQDKQDQKEKENRKSSDQEKKAKRKLIKLLEVLSNCTCLFSPRSSSLSPIPQAIYLINL